MLVAKTLMLGANLAARPSNFARLGFRSARARATLSVQPSISATRPPALAGDNIKDVDTPALLVDLDALERNCAKLKAAMASWPKVAIRPHCKAHKTPQIALLQLQLLGITGVCCQKVSEAEAMAEGGVRDILLSNEVVGARKIERLVGLAAAGAKISVCVESEDNARALAAEAARQGTRLGLLVEVNAGQDRCGLDSAAEAVVLGRVISGLDSVELLGIQAYHGGLQHVRRPEDRAAQVAKVADKARAVVQAMQAAGLPCNVVTGGGSGTYRLEAASGVFSEVQPGSFCFGDADYARNIQADGSMGEWEQSLWVLTQVMIQYYMSSLTPYCVHGTTNPPGNEQEQGSQVMSRSEARSMAVVDAGTKAVSLDSGPPILPTSFTNGIQVEYQNGGDEHGKLLWPQGVYQMPIELPAVGELLRLQPGHCDPTVNMYDWIVAYRQDKVEAVWPIRGRGPGC